MTAEQWLKLAAGVAAVSGLPVALPIAGLLTGIVKFLKERKTILDQADEWTPAQRNERDVTWATLTKSHAWLTDDEGGT